MKIIIPVIVGAIIGYVTNWLAIKMLFKPLREVKVFGVKMPFTPGLIPKEKARIARSVGDTIGKHLLSPEIIVKTLCSDKISTQIYLYIEDKLKASGESERSVKEFMIQFFGAHYNNFRVKIKEVIYESLYIQLEDDNRRNRVVTAVNEWAAARYSEFVKTENYIKLKENFAEKLSEYFKSPELRKKIAVLIENFINKLKQDDRKFTQVIPQEVLDEIKIYLFNHSGDIAGVLKELLSSAPLRDKLKTAVCAMIEQTFGGFVSRLVNPSLVSEKIIAAVQKYLNNEDNYNNIAAAVNRALEALLENKISEFAYSISEETRRTTSENITSAVLNYVDDREKRTKMVAELEKAAARIDLHDVLDTMLKSMLSDQSGVNRQNESLIELVENIMGAVENIKISDILGAVDEDTVKSISGILISAFENIIRNKAGYIVELIDIPEIVESEINSFDIEFAEKIIIDIANKELSAITWLGALLGGIMGLLTPVMQLLYK